MKQRPRSCALAFALVCLVTARHATAQTSPQVLAALDGLLAADRSFAAAGTEDGSRNGLSAMLADDAAMILAGKTIEGKAMIVDALRANADNARSRAEWTPLAGAISGDGCMASPSAS